MKSGLLWGLFVLLALVADTVQASSTCPDIDTESCEKTKPTVQVLLKDYSNDEIVSLLGTIYEHSPWVAQEFVAQYPLASLQRKAITTVSQLAAALQQIVNQASSERQFALLRAHPDLRDKAAAAIADLTPDSQTEQAAAGLDTLTAAELTRFHQLNTQYRDRFGFPFILAVRNASKHTILAALQGRVGTAVAEQEFVQALEQVHKIAWMRLLDKLDWSDAAGFLTCHVLDTANGIPGKCEYLVLFCLWIAAEFLTH